MSAEVCGALINAAGIWCANPKPCLIHDNDGSLVSLESLISVTILGQDDQMAKSRSTDTVTITATFTSDLQRNATMKTLRTTLAAWQRAAEEMHQETKITINYGSETKSD